MKALASLFVLAAMLSGCTPPLSQNASSPESLLTVETAIAAAKQIRLSTDNASMAAQFSTRLRWSAKLPSGQTYDYDCLVARGTQRVGIVFLSQDGLPFCYMTDKLCLMFDVNRPGMLLVADRGAPGILLNRLPDQDRLQAVAYFFLTAEESTIDIDIAGIVDGFLHKAHDSGMEPSGRTVRVKTEKASIVLSMGDKSAASSRLESVTIEGPQGTIVRVHDIRLGNTAILPSEVTRSDVENAGMRTSPMAPAGQPTNLLLVPPDFGRNQTERNAAMLLAKLLGMKASV